MAERTFYFWLLIKPKVDQSKPNCLQFDIKPYKDATEHLMLVRIFFFFWKCNLIMNLHVHMFVGWSVGRLVVDGL